MVSLLIDNIGELVTNVPGTGEGGPLGIRRNAAVLVEEGRIAWVGPGRYAPGRRPPDRRRRAARCCPASWTATPTWSSPGDRAAEFAARMAGEPYTGGGIRTTVAATRAASDDDLRDNVGRLVAEALRQGTTTIEIKSGYGLNVADEARSLRIAPEFTAETTFLGAHVVPAEYADRADDYVGLVCGPMLRAAAPYAKWVDVFCERGAFDADHARAILTVGQGRRARACGCTPTSSAPAPGVQLAVELGAASADHCTHLSRADVDALAGSPHGRDAAAGRGVLHPVAVPGRAPAARRRRHRRAGDRLQPRLVVHLVDAVLHRAGRPRDADDPGRGGLGGDRGRRAGAAPRRRRRAAPRRARPTSMVLDAPSYLHLAYRPGVPLVRKVLHNGVPA